MIKVLVLTNSINGLYSFRRELIENLIKEGVKLPFQLRKILKVFILVMLDVKSYKLN